MKITTSFHFGSYLVRIVCCAILALAVLLPFELLAQVRPIYDRGAVGLMQMLKRLNTNASVLMIGAHPDDEDTSLLAYLARGENARTAYLSLTRGDGGQNIIGTELGESLGIIRTEELLQARRLDGAEQFFTRAYDFGFSKTLDEAKAKWDEKVILCDAVRVIRMHRPLVVISQFSGTPADGHGHHQFAGYIAPIAVRAAGDALQCPDAGAVWTVKKFYTRHRGPGEARLRINTGRFDPMLGRSYFEIAMEARSQHKSQEQGVLELRGDQFSGLNLSGSEAKETGIFEGLDISPADEAGRAAATALREIDLRSPDKILPHLVRGYRAASAEKKGQFANAIRIAAGIEVDALADREMVVPGESVSVTVKAFVSAKDAAKVVSARIVARDRWTIANVEPPKESSSQGFFRRETGDFAAYFSVDPPADGMPTQPYWLFDPRNGDMYRWNREPGSHGLPVQPSRLRTAMTIDVLGTEVVIERPVEFRFADDIRGEIRRNVDVVPRVSVEMGQPLMIVTYSDKPQTKQVVMTLTNYSKQPVNGVVSLNFNTPIEWQYSASSRTFELKRTGEKTAVTFDVTVPARTQPGSHQISGQAMIGEALATSTMRTIAYPHIQTHRFYRRAVVDTRVIDLKTTPTKVGYITGSGDRVPDAIRQMGFSLELISEGELASGDLSKYDTIVVGIRAYQVRPEVVANNQRLLDYARDGGTLIVQYQLPAFAPLAPFPVQMGPRVTDENAKVTILAPDHPVFKLPNKITDTDFAGWVQERNLYNFGTMDAAYNPLLESHDGGEQENKGGLVIAKVGKGNWVYCSYSFFRQLPAGVPGAYRLFANLLSLPQSQNRLR